MGKNRSKTNMERCRQELMELARLNELLEPIAPKPDAALVPCSQLTEVSIQSVAEPIAPKPDVSSVPCSQHPEVESQTEITKDFVIAFVEEVEKAHQYFLFKEYLRANCHIIKHDTSPHDLAYEQARENQGGGKFNLLDLEEFKHCVKDYFFELRAKQYPNKDLYAVRTPIYYLVFRAREEGYVMDKDPEVELEKLKKFSPVFYRDCFVRREPSVEVEGRKVPSLSKRIKFPGSQFVPLLVRPKFVTAGNTAKSTVKEGEDVSSLLAAAHDRYGAIRAYYLEFQSKTCDREEFRGGCHRLLEPTANWMVVEAMANGGYTPGGNVWQRVPELLETRCIW